MSLMYSMGHGEDNLWYWKRGGARQRLISNLLPRKESDKKGKLSPTVDVLVRCLSKESKKPGSRWSEDQGCERDRARRRDGGSAREWKWQCDAGRCLGAIVGA
ncbi:hypothetical protein R1flu_027225 [Riccia fluitans]|uniref:Uncharacterized protein n=1 Tax=Riccia fluitans TaxID=41844 RepID=A0ABD1XI71_9MARC